LVEHFVGWSKTWDEWVTDERLLKMTPDNLERAKKAEQEMQAAKGQLVQLSLRWSASVILYAIVC
jgi:mortality factor 4-like protein 1